MKTRFTAVILLLATLAIGYFVYSTENDNSAFRFKLGLDLKGGTQLSYKADVSKIDEKEVENSMSALREVIEKRVNMFGVSEPVVAVEESGVVGGSDAEHRLVVELPGVTDINQAINLIGKTPLLEFKVLKEEVKQSSDDLGTTTADEVFIETDLTGRYLERATLEFDPTTAEPTVTLAFNPEGKDIFGQITRQNIGYPIAIYLDGQILSAPVVREEINDGRAQITGQFTPNEAKLLVRDLNYGSLPVPIELISTQTIGATLGERVLNAGVRAGAYGFLLIAGFLILWYRLPGALSVFSLITYILITLALYKLIPVTITAAGIAGFILSIGIAVDANILIFERMKEELFRGKNLKDAIEEGFARAWLSIRDGNLSGLISASILFWLGTSLVKGFALTLGLGILISMFTATFVTRTYLRALNIDGQSKAVRFLFGSGITKKAKN